MISFVVDGCDELKPPYLGSFLFSFPKEKEKKDVINECPPFNRALGSEIKLKTGYHQSILINHKKEMS